MLFSTLVPRRKSQSRLHHRLPDEKVPVAVEEMPLILEIQTNIHRAIKSLHLAAIDFGGNPQQGGRSELGMDSALYQ